MSSKYKIQKDKNGDPIQCDSCRHEVATSDFDWGPPFVARERPKRALCEFCATSFAGNATFPSERSLSDAAAMRREIWMSAAAVAHYIESKIKETT